MAQRRDSDKQHRRGGKNLAVGGGQRHKAHDKALRRQRRPGSGIAHPRPRPRSLDLIWKRAGGRRASARRWIARGGGDGTWHCWRPQGQGRWHGDNTGDGCGRQEGRAQAWAPHDPRLTRGGGRGADGYSTAERGGDLNVDTCRVVVIAAPVDARRARLDEAEPQTGRRGRVSVARQRLDAASPQIVRRGRAQPQLGAGAGAVAANSSEGPRQTATKPTAAGGAPSRARPGNVISPAGAPKQGPSPRCPVAPVASPPKHASLPDHRRRTTAAGDKPPRAP